MTEHAAPLRQVTLEFSPAFHDIDAMEVVWHGHYLKYFELARCALLQQIDYDYPQMRDSGFAWPVIDMRIKYVRPARYQQALRITATLVEWESRLKMEYRIEDAITHEKLTTGYTVQVAVSMPAGEMLFISPPVLWQKLGLEMPCT